MKKTTMHKINCRNSLASWLVIAGIALPLSGFAGSITNTVGNIDWNSAMWGSGPSAPTTGNDYFVAHITTGGNGDVRLGADGSSSTFGGDSLTVLAGANALSKLADGTTGTINGDLTLDGGYLRFGPNGGGNNVTLDLVNLMVTGTPGAQIGLGASMASATLNGTLTGSGDLRLFMYDSTGTTTTRNFVLSNISAYTGALSLEGYDTLSFGVDYTFANTLTLNANSQLVVNNGQTLTFGSGDLIDSVNGTVAPGTYTGSSLDALGSSYVNNGGTIVVAAPVPEPSTFAILGGGLSVLWLTCARRRVAR